MIVQSIEECYEKEFDMVEAVARKIHLGAVEPYFGDQILKAFSQFEDECKKISRNLSNALSDLSDANVELEFVRRYMEREMDSTFIKREAGWARPKTGLVMGLKAEYIGGDYEGL